MSQTDTRLNDILEDVEIDDDVFADEDVTPADVDHIPADDVVSVYFRQMAVEPLLNAEQEVALAKRIERGQKAAVYLEEHDEVPDDLVWQLENAIADGQAAREHLARANTRLVVSFAKRYRNQGLPMSDLIQEGNVGLMKAVDKFDYTMGNRFSTYASWWIRQTITRALSQKSRTIRLPLHLSDQLRRISSASEKLEQELGRAPTYSELARRIGVSEDKVRDAVERTPQTVALEMEIGDDNELGDFLEDEETLTPDEALNDVALSEAIEHTLETMVPREAEILRLRFGLGEGGPQTLEQVGKVLGLSRERIRQLERQAIQRLRQPQFAEELREFIPA
jgi:RNA polymerase primary sigma factor